jgi:hypothetical protein
MQNYLQTVISQYQNSPVLLALIGALNDAIDPVQSLQKFYDQIWNVKTATGYGLDVWGRIVGVSRYVNMSRSHRLGFATGFYPYNSAPWFDNNLATNNLRLADDAYRLLIMVKALANLSNCSAPSLNALLRMMFPATRGRCYVVDTGNMKFSYVFEFTPTDTEVAILTGSTVMPHPAGVAVSFIFP